MTTMDLSNGVPVFSNASFELNPYPMTAGDPPVILRVDGWKGRECSYSTVYGGERWCDTHDSAAPCPLRRRADA